jgi:hypothetical protein
MGYHESRRYSRDTYPASYTTKYTIIYILVVGIAKVSHVHGVRGWDDLKHRLCKGVDLLKLINEYIL